MKTTQRIIDFYVPVFKQTMELLGRPFHHDYFDFGDDLYFQEIYGVGEKLSKMQEFGKSKHPRGGKDGIYINRTYFGLYQLLNMLSAKVNTISYTPWSCLTRLGVALLLFMVLKLNAFIALMSTATKKQNYEKDIKIYH